MDSGRRCFLPRKGQQLFSEDQRYSIHSFIHSLTPLLVPTLAPCLLRPHVRVWAAGRLVEAGRMQG